MDIPTVAAVGQYTVQIVPLFVSGAVHFSVYPRLDPDEQKGRHPCGRLQSGGKGGQLRHPRRVHLSPLFLGPFLFVLFCLFFGCS